MGKKKIEWERQTQLHEVVGKKGKEKEAKTKTNSESVSYTHLGCGVEMVSEPNIEIVCK